MGEKFTQKYSRTFAELERLHDLDVDDPVDIFCLHHCFLPLVNLTIASHVAAHNHHPSATKGTRGWSPLRTWIHGNVEAAKRGMDLDLYPTDGLVDGNGFIDEVIEGEEDEDEDEEQAEVNQMRAANWPSEQERADQDRPVGDTDPYVQVERYHELLPPLLKEEDFRQTLRHHFPPPTQHSADDVADDAGLFSTVQYLAVRSWVHDSLLARQADETL